MAGRVSGSGADGMRFPYLDGEGSWLNWVRKVTNRAEKSIRINRCDVDCRIADSALASGFPNPNRVLEKGNQRR